MARCAFLPSRSLLPTLSGAALAGAIMDLAGNANWLADARHWFAANLLGFCIVLPVGLVVTWRQVAKLRLQERWRRSGPGFRGRDPAQPLCHALVVSPHALHHFAGGAGGLGALPPPGRGARHADHSGDRCSLSVAGSNLPYREFELRIEGMQIFLAMTSLISARTSLLLNERDLHLAIIDSKRRKAVRASRFKSQLLAHVGEEVAWTAVGHHRHFHNAGIGQACRPDAPRNSPML